jgi:signal transduction histidine kinase
VLVAAAYYGAAKAGQTLRATASVPAIRPSTGVGIAALYLCGLRWWPGVLVGEVVVGSELFLGDRAFPIGSLLGQQAGDMVEIVVGALLLRRLLGPSAAMDRVPQIRGILVALGVATAISATGVTLSMVAGRVVDASDATAFWRTWWLGGASGGLVALPLLLTWAHDAVGAWRRVRTWEGAAVVASVAMLTLIAFSTREPIRYTVFPALIWAAFRLGPSGATLSVAITAGLAIGVTANDLGPLFARQGIHDETLSIQLYVLVAALTTLFLSVVISERERSSSELAGARRREGAAAIAERRRIARELHDSVSQALFSTALHTRMAQKALAEEGVASRGTVGRSLGAIAGLTESAQSELRSLIFELRDPVRDGLVAAVARHASGAPASERLMIDVRGPARRLALSHPVETQLFAIVREALANVRRHADASAALVRVEAHGDQVVVEVRDNGRGFDTAGEHRGHFGIDSMRSRAAEIDGQITITSAPRTGTVVRVRVPAQVTNGAGAR